MSKTDEIVVLFSGGTDSTLASALMAEQFKRVHLFTCNRFGLFDINNSRLNWGKLQQTYGADKFTHRIIKVDKLFNFVCYEQYLKNLSRYGFMVLSICGLCKLAMHVRALLFCLDNGYTNVCDGANQGMYLFPDQMAGVLNEYKAMYGAFGINYTNPVFAFQGPQDLEFADRLHQERLIPKEYDAQALEQKKLTTGYRLHQMGLMPDINVKGTPLDRQMQARCFQFVLFNIFVQWYYLADHSYEQYAQASLDFFSHKIARFTGLLQELQAKGKNSRLFRLIEDRRIC